MDTGGEVWDTCHAHPHPQRHTVRKKTPASPFGINGLEPTCDTTTFKSPPEGCAPKTLALEVKRACIHKAHKIIANKETFLKGIPRNPGVTPPFPQEAALGPFFLPLPERDLFANLKNCCHGVRLLMECTHRGPLPVTLFTDLGVRADTISVLYLCSVLGHERLPGKSLLCRPYP